MRIIRTKKEIDKEIKRLLKDESNFVNDNYGSESADNGIYEVNFSSWNTEKTLNKFIEWLIKK